MPFAKSRSILSELVSPPPPAARPLVQEYRSETFASPHFVQSIAVLNQKAKPQTLTGDLGQHFLDAP